MLFTTKTEYGLKALRVLARCGRTKNVSLSDIAEETGLSLSYLEQIFSKLKKAGIVTGTKGAEGGYVLSRSAKNIDLLQIITALEGRTAVNSCMADGKQTCSGSCLTRRIWVEIQEDMEKKLKKYKLNQII